jgi:hypothetical protein
MSYGLTLGGYENAPRHDRSLHLELHGYSDANYANSVDDRRSVAGFVTFMWNSPISWSSKLESTIALSTTEAEYMALTPLVQEIVFLQHMLNELRLKTDLPMIVYQDNQSCIKLTVNPEFHQRTKHIDVRYHYVREAVRKGFINLTYVHTKANVADVLTKAMPKVEFERLRTKLRVQPPRLSALSTTAHH